MTPNAGHEQAGRRPAIVLSPATYNARAGLALMCPVTSQVKGYPFEVALPKAAGIVGVVLADQVRSVDWRARRAELASHGHEDIAASVGAMVQALLED